MVDEGRIGHPDGPPGVDDLASGDHPSLADGAQKLDVEGDGQNEDILDQLIDCEERCVIQRFEVVRAVNRIAGVVEMWTGIK